ncbi:MAG: hypothetical protein ACOX3T_08405 [Bdellovibrionota bacterium]
MQKGDIVFLKRTNERRVVSEIPIFIGSYFGLHGDSSLSFLNAGATLILVKNKSLLK